MSGIAGDSFRHNTGQILVLFILLVIIVCSCFGFGGFF
ncbi:sporulation protein YjcZ [Paenibacillus sp. IITD108]